MREDQKSCAFSVGVYSEMQRLSEGLSETIKKVRIISQPSAFPRNWVSLEKVKYTECRLNVMFNIIVQ